MMFENVVLEVTDNYGSDMTYRIYIGTDDIPSLSDVIRVFEDDNRDQGYWVTGARYAR
jgi:hypothetical protein